MRVLVVDDHAAVRESLQQLVEFASGFEVVGVGANGAEALELVESLQPDVVLMDMNMPVMNGVEATRRIKENHPEIQVLALTAFADMALVTGMVKAGASGYLLKGGSSIELLDALESVARGRGALDHAVTKGVMDDVADMYKTEQERADALAELDRMKSEFVSVVSHELRTPLTTIKGTIETLRQRWDDTASATKLELLDSMSRQCDRLTQMVVQILTVSGIQKGGLGLSPTTFRLDLIARSALASLQSKAEGRHFTVRLQPVSATGDRVRIAEVARALLDNALAFTDGDVLVEVLAGDGGPELRVSDQGPGLDESTLRRFLHEPFSQGDSSSTRAVGGLGLSLYIARQVLEASGGRLEIETSPGRGSIFTMVLRPPGGGAQAGASPRSAEANGSSSLD